MALPNYVRGEGHLEAPAIPHILVVDDDRLVRRSAARALTGAGFRTTECHDALVVLAALDSRRPSRLSEMASPGDSGALLMATDGSAVGLIFAAGQGCTYANSIENVQSALNVTVSDTKWT